MKIDINDPRARNLLFRIAIEKEAETMLKLKLIGAFMEGKVVEKIHSGIPPALSPETIERKGSSTPLVDTGQLVGQVTHKLDGKTVKVGIFGSRASIGKHHEFGAPRAGIPERSFLRSTFHENKGTIVKMVAKKL